MLGWKLREISLDGVDIKFGGEGNSRSRSLERSCLVKIGVSYANATKKLPRRMGEEVWVQVGNATYSSKLKALNYCLVGEWDVKDV